MKLSGNVTLVNPNVSNIDVGLLGNEDETYFVLDNALRHLLSMRVMLLISALTAYDATNASAQCDRPNVRS